MRSFFFSSLLTALIAFETKAQCSVCFEGSNPDTSLDKCPQIVDDAAGMDIGSTECEFNQLKAYQNSCCQSAPRLCTVCPDGAGFNAGKAVPNPVPGSGDLTCADLNGRLEFLDFVFEDGTCSDTLLQRSATWCECPSTSRECTLCSDGSQPANLDRIDPVFYGWNCEFFDFVSSFFSADDCPNLSSSGDILTIDAASFCGCPDTTAPTVCSLCGEGEVVKTGTDLGAFTCGELSLSTSYINTLSGCVAAKTQFRASDYIETCCFDPTEISAAGASFHLFAFVLMLLSLLSW